MHDAQRRLTRSALTPLALLALTMTLSGCGDEAEAHDRELYDMAIAGDAYKTWPQFPGASPDLYASKQHKGAYVRSYMNGVGAGALTNFSGSFPDGTILVKEQYEDAAGTVLSGHTVMFKIDGYDSDHGDWYWVAFNGAGETTAHNGMASFCTDCHTAAKTNDWVFTPIK